MSSLQMVFDVLAIDRASEVFRRVGDAAGESGKKVEAASTGVTNAGAKIAAGLGIAAAAATVASVKMAADFQASTTRLVTSANETQGNLELVRKGLLDMAGQVGYSVEDLATAMYKVESGGQHGAAGLQVLKAAAQGAKTENADLTTVADAVTSAMQDYHLKASDAADVTSKLVAATASGKMTFQELAGSMSAILPVASANHVSLNDILGDLASMTIHGMSAEQASQNLADAVRHLAAPTQVSQHELALLGFTAQQVSSDLSTKGLSGTVQELSQAVLKNLGPGTSEVVLQLGAALTGLNPAVRDLGQKLMDGTISNAEYVKAAKQLAPELQGQASQFATLAKSTHAIGNEQMTGSQVMQSYSGAMKALMGDATGMNVALMLTGENTKTTTTAIQNVTKATADASGNVKGWDLIQQNFNQKLDETKGHVQAMAIEFGTHLLPALTSSMGFINSTVLPGIEHLGSAVATTAKWFGELPQPIKDMALALAALRVADMVGIFDKLSSAAGRFREEMALQAALYKAQNSGLSDVERALGGVASSSGAAESGLSKFGTAAANVANRSMSALKAAGSGLMSMFGGPWGLAIAGATLGIGALNSVIQHHDEQIKKATDDVAKWYKTLALGGSTSDVIKAQQNLDGLRKQLADVTDQINAYNAAATGGNARGGIGTLITHQQELRAELDKGQKAWNEQLAAMTPVESATARLQSAEAKLAEVRKDYPANSQIVIAAEAAVATAQHNVASETDNATRSQRNQLQTMQDAANAALGQIDAQRALEQSQLGLSDAIAQYNQGIADGSLKGNALRESQLSLVDSAEATAKAAGDAAAKQAAQNGATDTGAASQAAFVKSLQDSANMLQGPAKQALEDAITALGGTTTAAGIAAGAINQVGVTIIGLPTSHSVEIDVPTDKQMKDLHDLGYATATLPNGHVVVTADTNPAQTAIQDLLNYARNQSILYRATLPDLNGSASGSGRPGMATGGWVRGPGTGTSDSVPIMGSNGEFMVNAKAAAQHAALLEAINSGVAAGYAQGGWINVPPGGAYMGSAAIPTNVDGSAYKDQLHKYLASAAVFSGGGAGSPLIRALGQNIANAMGFGGQFSAIDYIFSHESGWKPNAQNPTSTAYGIPQFLNSTWAQYGGKTSDPATQIRDGISYMRDRYGSPNGAAAFWQGHHWYDGGGYLMPGVTMAYNGTGKPERIRTAEQEAALGQSMTLRLDGAATTALLEGHAVKVVVGALDAQYNNHVYGG